ncbi:hypothetical protein A9Q75_10270 [Colwellia psychrerythraea]|uniref:Uncharacterized protein n=1 Tax=Colwellia psychrerythraea TaxID=28229 RepID=A0A1Y5ECX9_COLPS|nr:hypothetical protein A9Q75_10270 [Colwellia psychrerythraea]
MSKRIMTNSSFSKFKQLSFAFTLTLVILFTLNKYTASQNIQAKLLSSCMLVESNLPMNHINHPCHTTNMSNKSWISWLSGESKSTHLHFLDLVELIHYSFH